MVEAHRLAKRFGSLEALRDVSFKTRKGTITAMLGENGAGKTTTLKIVLGFLRPDSGAVAIAPGRVGYVPDRPSFFPWLDGWTILGLAPGHINLIPGRLGASRVRDSELPSVVVALLIGSLSSGKLSQHTENLPAKLLKAEGLKRVALVTDAIHMPRSRQVFESTGLEVIACPTAYAGQRPFAPYQLVPGAAALHLSQSALREWVSRGYYLLRYR